jgi:hypothetical protein
MKNENNPQSFKLSARMVEPEATEKLKKHARDLGLIVNAGTVLPLIGKKDGTNKSSKRK